MNIREVRKEIGLTQEEAANLLGVCRRTYINYEKEESNLPRYKINSVIQTLKDSNRIDETHGILTLETIKKICDEVFEEYDVNFCYLFGSYAKGKANEQSDVDLLISTNVTGLEFFGLIEELREKLHKKVDLLDDRQLINNLDLLREILKDGIKIYG